MRHQLEEAIKQLEDELASAQDLGPNEAAEIHNAINEISNTLDEKEVDSASLAEQLYRQTEAFQESHPVLTQTVGRIADMLSQMGI